MQKINRLEYLICLLFLLPGMMKAQSDSLSEKIANYEMHIDLDVEQKKLHGNTRLQWKNNSDQPVDELFFHMYYNAFRNSKSTFFSERGVPAFLTNNIDEECGWAWTHIHSFKDQNSNELKDSMQYVQTDDENIHDKTVLKIDLVDPVGPGESREFVFNWEAKIPKTMPRTGYNRDYYFFAQWFPKLGVLEPAGMRFAESTKWNCHQYHSNGEYYSNFGDYEVYITLPEDFVVAATGELRSLAKDSETKTWYFDAHDVIDFTWTCSPHYKVMREKYKHTEISLYYYDYKELFTDRYLSTIKYAMQFLDEHIGSYPYNTLSIIDPPIHGMFTGGMEYPNLVTSLSFRFFPEGFRTPETLVVHEYIHQYFMQMVATHELEEAWMDEGITSYYESRILDELFGENRSTIEFAGFKTGNKTFNRVEFFGMDHPSIAPNSIKSWEYKHGGYGTIAYNKAALWIQTLEGLLGTDMLDNIMKSYFDTWKFRHPCRNDFIEIVNTMVRESLPEQFPNGMDWFFDQVLYGTATCDYALASINNLEQNPGRGYYEDRNNCEILEENFESKYKSTIVLHRLDEMYFPQEVLLKFEDGTTQLHYWNGESRAHSIEVYTDLKVISAEIDPLRKIYIDKNFNNNSLCLSDQSKALSGLRQRILIRIQGLLEALALLI